MPVEDGVAVSGANDVELEAVTGDIGELLTPVLRGGE